MTKVALLDTNPTIAQLAIVGFWVLNLGLVILLWFTTTVFSSDLSAVLLSIAVLFGLLATFFALTQFMLMGRIAWIERHFGLDRLASYHRINGYLAIIFILIHPLFITVSYAIAAHVNVFQQYINLILNYKYVWLAFIAQILFISVVASSIYIARKRLKFESWYYVHLTVYVAIVVASFHQFAIGDSFAGGNFPLAKLYWLGLYIFVALNLIIWRFSLPIINLFRFNFRIDKVVAETPTTTSLYISGRHLKRWHTKPGQFVLLRIFSRGIWWQEHPFSLSSIPNDKRLRLTIRNVGDYTAAIAGLQPGYRTVLSGPFGRFTSDVAETNKRLFIAGGVGITPIRSLIEEAIIHKHSATLLYANKSSTDVIFASELKQFERSGLTVTNIYSDPPKGYVGKTGYIDIDKISRLVPDFKQRDIYLCGPPQMMDGVINGLLSAGHPPAQLHYERFALHG